MSNDRETTLTQSEIINKQYDKTTESSRSSLACFSGVIADASIPASGTAVTVPLDVENYRKKTLYISTTTACTIYLKGGLSSDGTGHGFLYSGTEAETEDDLYSWTVNNMIKAICIDVQLKYMSVVVVNTDASNACTIKIEISGG